ncbi:MAG: RHS repeat-associated core domain-containing protein [bacterium]
MSQDQQKKTTKVSSKDGRKISVNYNPNGKPDTINDTTYGEISYKYDILDRIKSVSHPEQKTILFEYDNVGNRTKITYPTERVVNYKYNHNNIVMEVNTGVKTTQLFYDKLNRLIKKRLPNGVEIRYEFYEDGRLNHLEVVDKNNGKLVDMRYKFDLAGNCLAINKSGTAFPKEKKVKFVYDAEYRLIKSSDTIGNKWGYKYNSAGNRIEKKELIISKNNTNYTKTNYVYNNNIMLKAGETEYKYDKDGYLFIKKKTNEETKYGFDEYGLLTKITYLNGTEDTYTYDYFGRRIFKRKFNGNLIRYFYDGYNIICEYDKQEILRNEYIYDMGADRLLCIIRNGNTYYAICDYLGSVVALIDETGKVATTYEYDPWGQILEINGENINPFLFTGREWDEESGLYFYRKRYYDPQTGRFISKDPLLKLLNAPDSVNPYIYVNNNPQSYIDPFGLLDNMPENKSTSMWYNWFNQGIFQPQNNFQGAASFISDVGQNYLGTLYKKTTPVPVGGSIGIPVYKSAAANNIGGFIGTTLNVVEFIPHVINYKNYFSNPTDSENAFLSLSQTAAEMAGSTYGGTYGASQGLQAGILLATLCSPIGAVGVSTAIVVTSVIAGGMIGGAIGSAIMGNINKFAVNNIRQANNVGGILLNQAATLVTDLEEIIGAYWDNNIGQLVLLGKKNGKQLNVNFPVMDLDHLMVALRAVYTDESLGVSIDPADSYLKNGNIPPSGTNMNVRYLGNTKETQFGAILFEADRILKCLSLGVDNVDKKPVVYKVQGYRNEIQMHYEPSDFVPEIIKLFDEFKRETIIEYTNAAKQSSNEPSEEFIKKFTHSLNYLVETLKTEYINKTNYKSSKGGNTWNRYWFEIEDMKLELGANESADRSVLFFGKASLKVKTEYISSQKKREINNIKQDFNERFNQFFERFKDDIKINCGKYLIETGSRDLSKKYLDLLMISVYGLSAMSQAKYISSVTESKAEEFALHLSLNFDKYAEKIPVFERLREIAKITAIAKWLKDSGKPIDLSLIHNYQLIKVPTPDVTPGFKASEGKKYFDNNVNIIQNYSIYGGVSFDFKYQARIDDAKSNTLKKEALKGKPLIPVPAWDFVFDGNVMRALTFPLTKNQNNYKVTHTDYSSGLSDKYPLELKRSYNSFDVKDSLFGMGWKLNIPYKIINFNKKNNSDVLLIDEFNAITYKYRYIKEKKAYCFVTDEKREGNVINFAYDQYKFIKKNMFGEFVFYSSQNSVFYFNKEGCLIAVSDGKKRRIKYNYKKNKLTGMSDTNGNKLRFIYDNENRINKIICSDGKTLNYIYNSSGELVQVYNSAVKKGIFNYTYDNKHFLISVYDASSKILVLNNYDSLGGIVKKKQDSFTDENGNLITRYFDYVNRLTKTEDTFGNKTVYQYDGNNYLIKTTYRDSQNRETIIEQNKENGIIKITNPLKSVTLYVYNELGNLTSITDANGDCSTFKYDEEGNFTMAKDALGNEWKLINNSKNKRIIEDPNGNKTEYIFNVREQLTKTKNKNSSVRLYYDNNGQLIKSKDGNGKVFRYFNNNSFSKRSKGRFVELSAWFFERVNGTFIEGILSPLLGSSLIVQMALAIVLGGIIGGVTEYISTWFSSITDVNIISLLITNTNIIPSIIIGALACAAACGFVGAGAGAAVGSLIGWLIASLFESISDKYLSDRFYLISKIISWIIIMLVSWWIGILMQKLYERFIRRYNLLNKIVTYIIISLFVLSVLILIHSILVFAINTL